MPNIVYIATSIDGYIAGKNGDIKWLIEYPNPEQSDYGFFDFMKGIDALIMGRNTLRPLTVLIRGCIISRYLSSAIPLLN